jgi:hypothetical protein
MGLFGSFRKSAEAPALIIDVSAGSVGGAYVSRAKGVLTLHYSARLRTSPRDGEDREASMLRTLVELSELLATRGAPILRREAGSAASEALVSIAAPWQETAVRIERIEDKAPFVLTRSIAKEALARVARVPEGRALTHESVIAAILNGYATSAPFGRRVRVADLVVLSSTAEEGLLEKISQALRAAHAEPVRFSAEAPSAFAVLRDLYPHEKQFLIFDVASSATEITLVRENLLTAIAAMPVGAGEESWMREVTGTLKDLAGEYALPRTLFILADDEARGHLSAALDDPALRALWLSDEPLTIVPITAAQLGSLVKVGPEGEADVSLMLLAAYNAKPLDGIAA